MAMKLLRKISNKIRFDHVRNDELKNQLSYILMKADGIIRSPDQNR